MGTVLGMVIGASIGAFIGWRGKCQTGVCPLTSNPYIGGLYGAILGALLAGILSSPAGPNAARSSEGSGTNVITQEQTANITKLESEKGFDQAVLQSPVPVLVDFWAPWCGPCRAEAPILDQLAGQYPDQVRIVKVNVDELEGLARRFDIRGIPTLVVFEQGREKTRLVGLHSLDQLKSAVGF